MSMGKGLDGVLAVYDMNGSGFEGVELHVRRLTDVHGVEGMGFLGDRQERALDVQAVCVS
jgi:hypothetical protein